MKRIIVLFVLLLGSIISIAQPVTQRGTTSVTVQDARLFAQYNFRPPVFPDTTSANTQIGLDSCGALIYSRDINAYYYRACSPKRWVRVSPGGSTSDSAYFSYRPLTDSTFLLCRVGGTRCDTIKVNGKGVSTAWLIGGNVNPIPPYIGTIDTKELDIITNNVVRMRVAGNGINRSSAARNKFLTMDTTTRYLYYTDGGGGIDTIPSLQDVATVGNYYANDLADTIRLNSYDGINNIKHPIIWTNDFGGGTPNNILDFSYGSGNQNVANIKFGESSGSLSTGYIEITDKQSVFKNELSQRTIIQNTPSAFYNTQTTYFPLMKGGTDTLATLSDVRDGGGNQNLQQVLDNGNTATTSINIENGSINAYNSASANIAALDGVNGNIVLRTGGTSAIIDASNITATDKNISLPNSNNTLAVSVNGNYADVNGNISISTGSGGIAHGTATGTDTYAVTISGVTSYADGDAYLVRFTNGNTTGATLNINGLGARTLYRNNDGVLIGGDIVDGGEMLCTYNSTTNAFQCIGTAPNTLLAYVTNADASTITKGQVVYAFGGTGDRMTVKLANNSSDATSAQTVGVVLSTSIATNQKGFIIVQGLLDGLSILPTSTYADGDPLFLGSTAGSITNIKPSAPQHLVYLGNITTASNGAAGRWYVRIQNGYELQELHNVAISSPANNQVLAFSDTQSLWKNRNIYTIVDTNNIIATKYRADTSRTNIYNALNGKQSTLTFSTGLTNSSGTVTSNLSTGVAGGQSVVGGTAASNSLTLSSTTNATKGNLLFGTSAYFENTNRLGINTSTDNGFRLDVNGTARITTNLTVGGGGGIAYKTTNGGGFVAAYGYFQPSSFTAGALTHYIDPVNNGYIFSAANSATTFISRAAINITNLTNTAGSESGDLTFSTQSGGTAISEKMRIFGGGNVGIGSSTDLGQKLYVAGNISSTAVIQTNQQIQSIGNTTANAQNYYLTNAGSNITTARIILGALSGGGTGNKRLYYDATNELMFSIGNTGGKEVIRAAIQTVSTNNTAGSEAGDLTFLTQSGGTAMSEKMRITGAGGLTINATNTASGTTGNQTINKASGTVNIAAAGTTVTVTNSLVTASSIVFAVIRTNDATATIKNVVPGAGSFVINLNAATTAETSIGFFVIN